MKSNFNYKMLKRYRQDLGMSQENFLFEIGKFGLRITRETLRAWETGKTSPTAKDLATIIQFFGKPIYTFFNKGVK